MNGTEDIFKYRGYIYCPADDIEYDNVKRYHNVYAEAQGVRVETRSIPFCCYTILEEEIFKRWIQMGMPTREELGGTSIDRHNKYWRKFFDKALDNILLENE